MAVLLLLLQVAADDALVRYRALTSVERRCVTDASRTDVTVCGLRAADRFRVPFIVKEPGDRTTTDVPQERDALIVRRSPVQELSPFLVGGGLVGITHSTRGGFGGVKARPTAP